ncbi:MAG: TIGR02453 family protein [Candidatus Acidiferrales bacterium]
MEQAIFGAETFRFFRDLGRNNSKAWMDENRDRYKQHVVEPFRRLLDALAPGVQKLHPDFCISGRTGESFSRINRDIRFAKDKTPYRTQMYLLFSHAETQGMAGGQLYVGLLADAVTVGLRMYYESRQSTMACVCLPRAAENLAWLARQRKKFARKYESYWYANEKGKWTKHSGWPRDAKEWKKAKGWIVRRKLRPSTALRPAFRREVEKTFRELFPLYGFSCLQRWKS